ncbi:MAG TPA: hypothetical protein VFR97_12145 [Capillimicrobium sp.]|nr:hypothetical protein [Capillimicrobium sp.]
MRLRTLLTVAACAAAGAVAAAPAQARDPLLAVEVTGIHVVDWTYATEGAGQECKAWSRGSGTQTLGIRTPRAARYEVLDTGMAKLLLPQGSPTFAGSAQRTGDWTDHAVPLTSACTPCGPRSEYGPCEDTAPDLLHPLYDCKRRTPAANAMLQLVPAGSEMGDGLTALADTLVVATSVPTTFTACPPDFDGSPVSLHSPQPLDVHIAGKPVKRLMSLRRGQRVALKGSAEAGYDGKQESSSCQAPAGGVGYRECAVTDVTVEVRRLR